MSATLSYFLRRSQLLVWTIRFHHSSFPSLSNVSMYHYQQHSVTVRLRSETDECLIYGKSRLIHRRIGGGRTVKSEASGLEPFVAQVGQFSSQDSSSLSYLTQLAYCFNVKQGTLHHRPVSRSCESRAPREILVPTEAQRWVGSIGACLKSCGIYCSISTLYEKSSQRGGT